MLADVARITGDDARCRQHCEQVLGLSREIGFDYIDSVAHMTLALVSARAGDPEAAAAHVRDAIAHATNSGSGLGNVRAHVAGGICALQAGDAVAAEQAFEQALALEGEVNVAVVRRECRSGLAAARLAQGRADDALRAIAVDVHLADLTDPSEASVEGCLEPGRVLLTWVRVLEAVGDDRLPDVRALGRNYLDEMARRIGDPDLVAGFQSVPINAELARAVRA
jgi:Tfp pilus assembly protein PilF